MPCCKRILLVGANFYGQGGSEVYTVELALSLRRLGYDVEVLSTLRPGVGECHGFPHTGLAPEDPVEFADYIPRWPQALREHLGRRTTTEDLVICVNPYTLPHVGPYARERRVPWAVIFYGVDAFDLYDSLRDEMAIGGTVISIGDYTAGHIYARVRPAAGPVELLPPPVDTETFFPDPGGDSDREAGEPLVLLTVSRMGRDDWYKGHDVVIDALPYLNQRVEAPIEYWIVGEGELVGRLRAQAAEVGCADQLRFLGFLERQQLVETYRRADVYVMPSCMAKLPDGHSTGEGFGMVFAEAAACGTPSVGLADAGAREAIAEGISGYAVATREEVAPAVLRLLRDEALRRELGRAAAEWAASTFPRRVFDRQLQRILDPLVGPAVSDRRDQRLPRA